MVTSFSAVLCSLYKWKVKVVLKSRLPVSWPLRFRSAVLSVCLVSVNTDDPSLFLQLY